MFTGIVETIGTVQAVVDHAEEGKNIVIHHALEILQPHPPALGDSISVNGVCLTVTHLNQAATATSAAAAAGSEFDNSTTLTFGVAPETLRRSTLGTLVAGSPVNLERAVTPETRLGGHMVQGHVDSTARILDIRGDGEAKVFRFQPATRDLMKYIVEKGFVCVDGASLTVTAVNDDDGAAGGWFEVMLVVYTQSKVVTAAKAVGDAVNIEVDQVGKYVERSVQAYFEGEGKSGMLEAIVAKLVDQRLKARGAA